MGGGGDGARDAAEAVARRSYGKLVAFIAGRSGDVAAAEDALSEAFAAALQHWPAEGVPSRPEAWLLTAARRRQIDAARRRETGALAAETLKLIAEEVRADTEDDVPDRRLGLLFACADPAIDSSMHAPLMLQTVLGLDARRIASAFLTSPAAMGKRLVRAKALIAKAGIPFAIPDRDALPGRLGAVLDAIYAAFSEGWTDPGGADLARRDLTHEALFLARLAAGLMPDEPEALGLLALILHAEARRLARRGPAGEYVAFAEQDLSRWDTALIAEAEEHLRHASGFGVIGRYQLEAALQSAHVHRRRSARPNWVDVLRLYDALLALSGSPVVAINRALAVAEVSGPEAGLIAMPDPADDKRVYEYQPYWAARAELLAKAGQAPEARQAYAMATGLESDPAVRRFLMEKAARLTS